MQTSLASLVGNLEEKDFKNLSEYFDGETLLKRKELYPYDYMDSLSKFKDSQPPQNDAFYSKLNDEHISEDDYQHVH